MYLLIDLYIEIKLHISNYVINKLLINKCNRADIFTEKGEGNSKHKMH